MTLLGWDGFNATYGASKYFLLGTDGVTDGVSFYIQATIVIEISKQASGDALQSLESPTLTFTYADNDGTHERVVDVLPGDAGYDDTTQPIKCSLFGTWSFIPNGDNATFHVTWNAGITSLTNFDLDAAGGDAWEGVVVIMPDAQETDPPVVS